MRSQSWPDGYAPAALQRIMNPDPHPACRRPAAVQPDQEALMTWQTPQAVDIRLGFEITMYVAAR